MTSTQAPFSPADQHLLPPCPICSMLAKPRADHRLTTAAFLLLHRCNDACHDMKPHKSFTAQQPRA